MSDLKEIGFYTLSNERAKNMSEFSQMKRCEMIITEYCNFKCKYCRGLDDKIYGDRVLKQLLLDEVKKNIDLRCTDLYTVGKSKFVEYNVIKSINKADIEMIKNKKNNKPK